MDDKKKDQCAHTGCTVWRGMTADIVALTAKRSRATPSFPANAGMRNLLARLTEQSFHDRLILGGKLEAGKVLRKARFLSCAS